MKRTILGILLVCSALVCYTGSSLCQQKYDHEAENQVENQAEHQKEHIGEHQHEREHSSYLECERQRYMWQQPQRVMNAIGVKPGMVIGDLGAGEGYFTLRLAERVGEGGRVYANEIDREYLALIKVRCEEAGLGNVTTVLGTEEAPGFPPGELDMILMVNVYHFLEDPITYLQHTKKGLKPGGELIIIQWETEKMALEHPDMSPSERQKYAKKPLLDNVKAAGYELVREETFLSQQNIYIFRPGE